MQLPEWSHNVIERRKGFDKQFFRRLCLLITSAIRHRLSTASLVKEIDDIYFELLEKLQSGDTYLPDRRGRCNRGSLVRLAWGFPPTLKNILKLVLKTSLQNLASARPGFLLRLEYPR